MAKLIWTSCLPSKCKDEFIDVLLSSLDESISPLVDKYVPIDQYPFVHNITAILGGYQFLCLISFYLIFYIFNHQFLLSIISVITISHYLCFTETSFTICTYYDQ